MVPYWISFHPQDDIITQCLENMYPSVIHYNYIEISTWYIDENGETINLFYRNYAPMGEYPDETESMSLLGYTLSKEDPVIFIRTVNNNTFEVDNQHLMRIYSEMIR